MKKSFKTYLLLFFLIFGFGLMSFSQGESSKSTLNKEIWEEEKKSLDYGDVTPEEKEEKEEPKDLKQRESWNLMDPGLAKAILFGIIILAVLFILYLIFGSMVFQNKKVIRDQRDFSLSDIEENLDEADLDHHIEQSLGVQDYKKAIRLYYLSIIKELNFKESIEWQKDKTNFAYVSEMRPQTEYHSFRDLTTAFEIVWYSEAEILKTHFDQLDPIFNKFLSKIRNNEG